MLQSFRENIRGFTAVFLIGLLTIPFAFVGVDSLFLSGAAAESALVVNGEKISELKVQRTIASERNAILQANPGLDEQLLSDELLRPRAEQQLIAATLLSQAARDAGMAIGPRPVAQQLAQIGAFQSDGRFDADRYRYTLQQQGYTSAEFKATVADELLTQQFSSGLVNSSFVTASEIDQLAEIIEQTRDYYYLVLSADTVAAQVAVEAGAVEAFYAANSARFSHPEQLVVDYIELSLAGAAAAVELAPAAVEQRLAQLAESATATELRSAAHILLAEPSAALLAELSAKLANGESFEQLAADYSTDIGSADAGGELGFSDGTAFPEPFEAALANLTVGEVSAPVQTEAGTHLIKLLAVEAAQADQLLQRSEVERALRAELAQSGLAAQLASLKELSFNAESLATVAEQLGVSAQRSEPFSRSGGSGIAAQSGVVSAAFSDDVRVDGFASEVLELGDDRYAVVKVVEQLPASLIGLDEVRDEIVAELRQQQVAEQLQVQAMEYIAELEQGATVEQLAKRDSLSWQVVADATMAEPQVQREVLQRAFAMANPQAGGSYAQQALNSGDLAVVALRSVKMGSAAELLPARRTALRSGLAQSGVLAELGGYQNALLAEAEVKR